VCYRTISTYLLSADCFIDPDAFLRSIADDIPHLQELEIAEYDHNTCTDFFDNIIPTTDLKSLRTISENIIFDFNQPIQASKTPQNILPASLQRLEVL
jgi:hypothetical protein